MSTLFEFASAGEGGDGRPVVVMNCPHYRKAVNHGLRWWEASGVGINVDDPADMVAAVRRALEDRPEQREKRRQAVDLCYAYADGRASERAGEAITETIRRLSGRVSVPIGSGRVYQPLLNGSIPNPNGHKKYSAQKWATMRTSYFDRNQVALRAVNRLRNFNRGYTPRGSGVERGINALRGRVFFTDEQHAKELVQQGQAEYAPDVHFPGTEPALPEVEPIEELTEADVPEVICSHTGHGYYDVVFDGHVKGRERGKKAAELAAKKLVEDWKRENLPQEDDMVNA